MSEHAYPVYYADSSKSARFLWYPVIFSISKYVLGEWLPNKRNYQTEVFLYNTELFNWYIVYILHVTYQ